MSERSFAGVNLRAPFWWQAVGEGRQPIDAGRILLWAGAAGDDKLLGRALRAYSMPETCYALERRGWLSTVGVVNMFAPPLDWSWARWLAELERSLGVLLRLRAFDDSWNSADDWWCMLSELPDPRQL